MANPVFQNSDKFQPTQPTIQPVGFDASDADLAAQFQREGVMTYEGVLVKSASLFLLALAVAVPVGMFAPGLALPLAIAAFVMSLVVIGATREEPKPALFAATIALYGGAAGALSRYYEGAWSGIILQALVATAVVFVVSLAVYRSGRVRNMTKIRRFLAVAIPSYVVFSLINFGMILFGGPNIRDMNIPGTSFPLGIALSAFAILLGAFMLISDFDAVDRGVKNALDAKWEWTAAYGLVFSIIWIYVEMLRLLSYLRDR